ncbi:MAG: hypothetical protein GWP61_03090 [Chloroflexi bacterium]|jgi:hypothetical protein|nr:hypothetical protein [Chloroflexota bacterium]
MGRSLLDDTKTRLSTSHKLFIVDYTGYLRLRGFEDHVNDWFFVKRGFLTCWLEPGFHNFWRVWNPGISYFCFRFYLLLGGRRKRELAAVVVFFVNGVLHNLLFSLITGRYSFPLPFTFLSFGALAVASQHLQKVFNQRRLPAIVNAAINIGLVIGSFDFGFRMNDILRLNLG